MRSSPDQLGRPRGARAGAPAGGGFPATGVMVRGTVRWLGGADMIVSPVVVKTSVTTRSSPYLAGARRSSGFGQKKTQAQMGSAWRKERRAMDRAGRDPQSIYGVPVDTLPSRQTGRARSRPTPFRPPPFPPP